MFTAKGFAAYASAMMECRIGKVAKAIRLGIGESAMQVSQRDPYQDVVLIGTNFEALSGLHGKVHRWCPGKNAEFFHQVRGSPQARSEAVAKKLLINCRPDGQRQVTVNCRLRRDGSI